MEIVSNNRFLFYLLSDDHYAVVDYCPRSFVQLQEVDNSDNSVIIPGSSGGGSSGGSKSFFDQSNLALLTLLQSQEQKTVEWLLSFHSESERRAWCRAFSPLDATTAGRI